MAALCILIILYQWAMATVCWHGRSLSAARGLSSCEPTDLQVIKVPSIVILIVDNINKILIKKLVEQQFAVRKAALTLRAYMRVYARSVSAA